MIHFQALKNRRDESLAFLSWVFEVPEKEWDALPETKDQMINTLFFLAGIYSIQLHGAVKSFKDYRRLATMDGTCHVRRACLYVRCIERSRLWLKFDWGEWAESIILGEAMEGEIHEPGWLDRSVSPGTWWATDDMPVAV